MTDEHIRNHREEDLVEDTQDYIEGRLETGAQQDLEQPTRRLEQLEDQIRELERRIEEGEASEDLHRHLDAARGERETLRSRERGS